MLGFGNGAITFSGYWDTDDLTLYSASEETSPVRFYGYPSVNAPSLYIAARVWVDYSMPDINVNSAVPVRGNLAVASEFVNTMS